VGSEMCIRDSFATPESFDFVDAVLEFLDAIPT